MGKTLTEIAEQLKHVDKKVQLIYAFNGSGKTRLSRELKNLIASKAEEDEEAEDFGTKILYYNAFTEDLFYWDNDLENDTERKLKIHPNAYTHWALQEQGQDQNAIAHFQHYTSSKLTPYFSALDENHLIDLAVNLAELIKSSQSGLKFIITTHFTLLRNLYEKTASFLLLYCAR